MPVPNSFSNSCEFSLPLVNIPALFLLLVSSLLMPIISRYSNPNQDPKLQFLSSSPNDRSDERLTGSNVGGDFPIDIRPFAATTTFNSIGGRPFCLKTKQLSPSGVYAFLSAAMLCFFSYAIIAGGNPPLKKQKSNANFAS